MPAVPEPTIQIGHGIRGVVPEPLVVGEEAEVILAVGPSGVALQCGRFVLPPLRPEDLS